MSENQNRIEKFLPAPSKGNPIGDPFEEGTQEHLESDDVGKEGTIGASDESVSLEDAMRALPRPPVPTPADWLVAPCAGGCATLDDKGIAQVTQVRFPPPKLRPGDHERVYCVPCATKLSGQEPPPGVEYARVGRHPAHRNVALIADRFAQRLGRPPRADAVQAFTDQMLAWTPQHGDLGQMNDDIEAYRLARPSLWAMAYPIQPADTQAAHLEALRGIAGKLEQALALDKASEG